jgi:hypothetical protein
MVGGFLSRRDCLNNALYDTLDVLVFVFVSFLVLIARRIA